MFRVTVRPSAPVYRHSLLRTTALAAAGAALALTGVPVVVVAAAAAPAHNKVAQQQSNRAARLRTYPPKCLEQNGFGHIKRIAADRWQGTIGQEPRTKRNDSAFVQGPFASVKRANRAARKARRTSIAYAGGPFVVSATRASSLAQETSLAATCLARLTEPGYRF